MSPTTKTTRTTKNKTENKITKTMPVKAKKDVGKKKETDFDMECLVGRMKAAVKVEVIQEDRVPKPQLAKLPKGTRIIPGWMWNKPRAFIDRYFEEEEKRKVKLDNMKEG